MRNALTAMMAAGQPDQMNRVSASVPPTAPVNPAEQAYFQRLANQYPQLVEEYSAHPESKSGKVINTDVAREMSPEYREDRTRSADVHEPSSQFMKKLFAEKLANPTPLGMDNTVVFSAGGTGAGKTTALDVLEKVDPALARAEMIYDTNMNKFESADKKIKQALEAETQGPYYLHLPRSSRSLGAWRIGQGAQDGKGKGIRAHRSYWGTHENPYRGASGDRAAAEEVRQKTQSEHPDCGQTPWEGKC